MEVNIQIISHHYFQLLIYLIISRKILEAMKTQIHVLLKEDKKLFNGMIDNYLSSQERDFFEKLRHKQESCPTIGNDLLLWENDNDDHLYIYRCMYDEYVIGRAGQTEKFHFMSLAQTLNANLKDMGLLDSSITVFQWLRKRNYNGMQYNHNFDNY